MKSFLEKFVAGIRLATAEEAQAIPHASIYHWPHFFLAASAAQKLREAGELLGSQEVWRWWKRSRPKEGKSSIQERIEVFMVHLTGDAKMTFQEAALFVAMAQRNRKEGKGISAGGTEAELVRQISIALSDEITEVIRFPNGTIGYRLDSFLGQLRHCDTAASRAFLGRKRWRICKGADVKTGEGLEAFFCSTMLKRLPDNSWDLPDAIAAEYGLGKCGKVLYAVEGDQIVWRSHSTFVEDLTINAPKQALEHAERLCGELRKNFLASLWQDVRAHDYWSRCTPAQLAG